MRVSLSYFEQILGEREFRKKPGRYLISWIFNFPILGFTFRGYKISGKWSTIAKIAKFNTFKVREKKLQNFSL